MPPLGEFLGGLFMIDDQLTKVISWQAETERQLARDPESFAIFVAPTLLDFAPLLFDPEDIERYENSGETRYCLKENAVKPQGALTDEEFNDPERLSAILNRCDALKSMFEAGNSIYFIGVSKSLCAVVEGVSPGALVARYPDKSNTFFIAPEALAKKSKKLPTAAYAYNLDRDWVPEAVITREDGKRFMLFDREAEPYVKEAIGITTLLVRVRNSAPEKSRLRRSARKGFHFSY